MRFWLTPVLLPVPLWLVMVLLPVVLSAAMRWSVLTLEVLGPYPWELPTSFAWARSPSRPYRHRARTAEEFDILPLVTIFVSGVRSGHSQRGTAKPGLPGDRPIPQLRPLPLADDGKGNV